METNNNNLIKQTDSRLTLAQRLKIKRTPANKQACLLLDISGSMTSELEPGHSKLAALKQLVKGMMIKSSLDHVTIYAFNWSVNKVAMQDIDSLHATGGTALHSAFNAAKSEGFSAAVLITDGIPDNRSLAINASTGLSLQILYVGPDPRPKFLDELSNLRGGQAASFELGKSESLKELELKIKGLLQAPDQNDSSSSQTNTTIQL